jgi:hypothetical protein
LENSRDAEITPPSVSSQFGRNQKRRLQSAPRKRSEQQLDRVYDEEQELVAAEF